VELNPYHPSGIVAVRGGASSDQQPLLGGRGEPGAASVSTVPGRTNFRHGTFYGVARSEATGAPSPLLSSSASLSKPAFALPSTSGRAGAESRAVDKGPPTESSDFPKVHLFSKPSSSQQPQHESSYTLGEDEPDDHKGLLESVGEDCEGDEASGVDDEELGLVQAPRRPRSGRHAKGGPRRGGHID